MITAGIATAPIATRQSTASLAPTIVDRTIPTPITTWKVSTSRPRSDGGASSATYIGTVCVPPPTAKPSTTRPKESSQGLGASAQLTAPTAKTNAMNRIVF
jgi:hypothetical protein